MMRSRLVLQKNTRIQHYSIARKFSFPAIKLSICGPNFGNSQSHFWMPGVAAFWPLLLRRWIRKAQPAEERNAHRDRAREGG